MSTARIPTALGGLGVAFFLAVVFTPLANRLNHAVVAPAQLEAAQAIVVLASAVYPDGTLSDGSLRRALHGMVLHRRGLASLLVFSGMRLPDGPGEAEVRADLAQVLGIPSEAILTASGVETTRDEAVRVAALLHPRGVRRILLVSDSRHLARAGPLFERLGFEVRTAPTDPLSGELTAPGARLELMRTALLELIGQLYYRVAGYL